MVSGRFAFLRVVASELFSLDFLDVVAEDSLFVLLFTFVAEGSCDEQAQACGVASSDGAGLAYFAEEAERVWGFGEVDACEHACVVLEA